MDVKKINVKNLGLDNVEELDIVKDLVSSGSFGIFLKIVEKFCSELHKDVVLYNLAGLDESSLSHLAYRKMKAQGADKLLVELRALQEAIKNKQ